MQRKISMRATASSFSAAGTSCFSAFLNDSCKRHDTQRQRVVYLSLYIYLCLTSSSTFFRLCAASAAVFCSCTSLRKRISV